MHDKENLCPTCGKETGQQGHMCVPTALEDKRCDWCEALIPDERHLCSEKVKALTYICNSCGRTAVRSEHLCNHVEID